MSLAFDETEPNDAQPLTALDGVVGRATEALL